MRSLKEKLSILSEMIAFAKADNEVKPEEYGFLQGVAEQLGIRQEAFETLFHEEVEHVIPKSEADRILQFHRLVLLMNVDNKQEQSEINRIHNIGLGMGLPPFAIEQVLSIMHQYPNNVVPPKVLIGIFKAHHN
ncbi:TerB family tellurite resistance protein [Maribacter sp. ANRC-HE7]|uniref:TerB family tellurite resistance protein n=1 Tax=Maribacter aquimaris TaxID=2737171 RepID=A0ABR7V5A3_9FLAO|nr:TerB family tellurite resistance protein [Maribacter aquimaris]MBD0779134.1 TerB family tellurite resistance protein [Maribacter aquimaris]